MKYKLLAGVALVLAFGMTSSAWANPKNSFSDNNTTKVISVAVAKNSFSNNGRATANSESFNVSVEGVSNQTLTGVSVLNIQAAVAQANNSGAQITGDITAEIRNGNANASNSGATTSGITQAAAAAGNGALNVQGASVGAGGNVSF